MQHRGKRPTSTPEERVAKVEALTSQLTTAVLALTSSTAWAAMLRTAAKFHRYSVNNVLLLWLQAEERGMALSQVAGYRTWQSMQRQVRRGERALKVLAPVRRRLTDEEAAARVGKGQPAYGDDGRPLMVVCGFRTENVWDISQTDGEALPTAPTEMILRGAGPAGLWDGLVHLVEAAGYRLERNPARNGAHGWTNCADRVVSVRPDVDEAEAVRVLAHELGHIRADHEHREIARAQRETEADGIAYVIATACGLDLEESAAGYVAGWSNGDPELLRTAAETVHKAATAILADLERYNAESMAAAVPLG
ncbi:ArdC-like ssDNA-binding domain-containing protein [Pseudonocardia eucalypti]